MIEEHASICGFHINLYTGIHHQQQFNNISRSFARSRQFTTTSARIHILMRFFCFLASPQNLNEYKEHVNDTVCHF